MKFFQITFLTICSFIFCISSYASQNEEFGDELAVVLDEAYTTIDLFAWDALKAYREISNDDVAQEVWGLAKSSQQLTGMIRELLHLQRSEDSVSLAHLNDVQDKLESLKLYFETELSDAALDQLASYPNLGASDLDRVEERLNTYETEAKRTVPSVRLTSFIQREIKSGFLDGEARQALGVSVELFRETVECLGQNALKGKVVIGTCLVFGELDNSNRESLIQIAVFEDAEGFTSTQGYQFTVLSSEEK